MTATSYPLTYAQESLYFLEQLTNGQPVYNMPQAFRSRGSLDLNALERAVRCLVTRHEALRTKIVETSKGPYQIVGSAEEVCFRVHEPKAGEESPRLQEAVVEPFDLKCGPVFRVDLFRLGPSENMLLLNLHHFVGDMSSLGIIFHDLATAYAAYRSGNQPRFETEPLQLGVFAAEKRSREISEETLQFWRDNLNGFTSELELPLDRFRPKYPSFRGAAHYLALSGELRGSLAEIARKNKSSLYMVCLAALQTLLHRYSGQEKFALATPFTDRDDPKLEQTIGYLINLLPIACDVRVTQNFRELLSHVRAQCLSVYAHHEISFRRIIQELGISSDNPKPPLARVVFQYFPEIASLELSGLQCEPVQVHSGTSKFDLCVSLWEATGKITTEIEYDTDIYEEASIQRFAKHFQNLLQALSANPDQPVGDIVLADAQEQQLIERWSAPVGAYPREKTVHALFEEQVALNPNKTALLFENEQISYGLLNERANEIAAHLQNSGVHAGDFVGVCLDRSPDLIAALIGILKTGSAFVPFEASYPKSRLEYLFADSAVRFLLTDSKNARIAPAETRTILLDQKLTAAGESAHSEATPENVAYMMYTSGSTGEPKGTMIPHRAIIRLVKNNDFAQFGPDRIFLAFAPVSFDASTLEIWGALLNGGTLAIYPPKFDSVEQFEEVLQRHKVTTLWLTAGLFNTIVDRKIEALLGVRQLLVGGDVLSVAHIQKALAALPNTELINGYGPTENTTFTCCYRIPRDFAGDRSVPIGQPINNTSVYILDERLHKTAIGVPGDLYAGGDGLSLGYWRKPELTEKNFLPNRFDGHGRLYKTGDRARFLEDGTIEFLGRRDSQVKIRGFRIEIEEVEAAFRKLAPVQDVAVVTYPDSSGTKSLVAYVVLKPRSTSITPADLQAQLGNVLPAHACPSRVLFLPELPLGANGKVNRTALPAPAHLPGSESELAAPTNEIEEKLVQLWRQVLEVPTLGIDDNFFHLGGESLRAMRALSQINAAFNCRLSLPRIFEAPTIRQMARLVEVSRNEPAMPTIKSRSIPDSIPDVNRLSEQDVDVLLSELLADNAPRK
jgi:amino acid adenylation domain-containing protein